jgi:polysaccharide pyruvyl transferase WcaK-like protein
VVQRRTFLQSASAAVLLGKPRPRLLLRSGWQSENIGDIAHTPGMLALLEKHVPEAQVTLVSTGLGDGVKEMLARRFPKLEFAETLEPGVLREWFPRMDAFLHSSGPGVVGAPQLRQWAEETAKPFGVFGVTVPAASEAASSPLAEPLLSALQRARFFFTRETESLRNARAAGLTKPKLAFAPDSTFSVDLQNREKAEAFLRATGLHGSRFLAVIPRLRFTPYHKMRPTNWTPAEIERRERGNLQYQEEDAAKLREVIIRWVRETGGKALLCPEMTYQLEILKPLLEDPLPEDVKKKVVRRQDYWLTDEASSVYAQAEAVVSSECHSPILAVANGVPCFYVRQPEDGIKGQMWTDVGLGDWAPRMETLSATQLAGLVMDTLRNREKARQRARQAAARARKIQAEGMQSVRSMLAV